jgi:hypothetical protein
VTADEVSAARSALQTLADSWQVAGDANMAGVRRR